MTLPAFLSAVKGYAKAQGAKEDEEISEEEFLMVLAEELEAGRVSG